MRGVYRLKQWVRRMKLSVRSKSLILLYHRITEAPSDPHLLCVTPQHFREHLEHLCQHYQPISLRTLNKTLDAGRMRHKLAVITFDDGYGDNLHEGYPLLKRYGIPATVFVTSGWVGLKRAFWWPELERILLWSDHLPRDLRVTINGKVRRWDLGDGAQPCEALTEEYRRWNITVESCPTSRHKVYRELCSLFRPLDAETREAVLNELREQAEFREDNYPFYRPLDRDELRMLSNGGLIEIASHTVTHPVLACESLDAQRWELEESKRQLEAMIGQPVTSFSYPYGGSADVGNESQRLVQEAGYELACANFPGPVTYQSNPYWLPRFLVRDWDGEEFARRLRSAFKG